MIVLQKGVLTHVTGCEQALVWCNREEVGEGKEQVKEEGGEKLVPDLFGKRLVVTGGIEDDGARLDSVELFDPNTGEWSQLPALQAPRYAHGIAVVGATVYVCGGRDAEIVVLPSL